MTLVRNCHEGDLNVDSSASNRTDCTNQLATLNAVEIHSAILDRARKYKVIKKYKFYKLIPIN